MLKGRQKPLFGNIERFGLFMPEANRRPVVVLCLSAIAITAGFLWLRLKPGFTNSSSLARLDHPLPSLTVENSEGTVDLKSIISGTRSVIVFYSTSCKTCRKVLPALQPFPDTLRLILVNESPDEGDLELSGLQHATRFQDRRRILSRFFAAAALPTILFVDEAGILREGIVGFYRRGFVQGKLRNFAAHSNDRARQIQ